MNKLHKGNCDSVSNIFNKNVEKRLRGCIMPVTVSITSDKDGEIKRFLEKFYEKTVTMEDDVEKWVYIYNKPLEAVDIISALADNQEDYELSMYIQVNDWKQMKLSKENQNLIVKSIFFLYYEEQ